MIKIIILLLVLCSGAKAQNYANSWIYDTQYSFNIDFVADQNNLGLWIILVNYNNEFFGISLHPSNESIQIDMTPYYLYGFAYFEFYYINYLGQITYSNNDYVFFS